VGDPQSADSPGSGFEVAESQPDGEEPVEKRTREARCRRRPPRGAGRAACGIRRQGKEPAAKKPGTSGPTQCLTSTDGEKGPKWASLDPVLVGRVQRLSPRRRMTATSRKHTSGKSRVPITTSFVRREFHRHPPLEKRQVSPVLDAAARETDSRRLGLNRGTGRKVWRTPSLRGRLRCVGPPRGTEYAQGDDTDISEPVR
jgi:hypothetical protein